MLQTGDQVGSYRIHDTLGSGGMGVVFRAEHVALMRPVALKVLRPEHSRDPTALSRFITEARAVNLIRNEHIVEITDLGVSAEGHSFYVMELLEGDNLQVKLRGEGPLPLARVLHVAIQVADALVASHRANIIHRDLKPANIVCVLRGGDPDYVKLLDFGIAKLIDGSRKPDDENTRAGSVLGTPHYMSPEQCQGFDVDHRSDIYSLGVVLFQLATGKLPYTGASGMEVAAKQVQAPFPSLSSVAPAHAGALIAPFELLVNRAVAKDREARWPSMAALKVELEQLRRALSGGAVREDPTGPRQDAGELRMAEVPSAASDSFCETMSPAADLTELPTELLGLETLVDGPTADGGAELFDRRVIAGNTGERIQLLLVPFRNLGSPGDDHIVNGLSEDLIDVLAMTPGLAVYPHTRVAWLTRRKTTLDELLESMPAKAVVDGSVERRGEQLHLSVRLLAPSGVELWAERTQRSIAELFLNNEDLARSIARVVNAAGRPAPRLLQMDAGTVDRYLRARALYHSYGIDTVREAVRLYELALAQHGDDPILLSGYAVSLVRLGYVDPSARTELAIAAATRAVALGPHLGEPHVALGSVLVQQSDFEAAIEQAAHAIKKAPWLAEAHELVGLMQGEVGLWRAGLRRLAAAVSLDPGLIRARLERARIRALIGDWAGVETVLEEHRSELETNLALQAAIARFALWRNRYDEVFQVLERHVLGAIPMANYIYESMRAGRERTDLLEPQLIDQAPPRRRTFHLQLRAEVQAAMAQPELALASIEAALDHGLVDLLWLEGCPLFAAVREDPRYARVLAEVKRRAGQVAAQLQRMGLAGLA